ncbi:hypothetical protein [Acinetobacter sp.]|uniref:hypothetical protein n=1 Tax=Acinetobacter sp. TaxID=472 RepID=UPI003B00A7E3
MAESLLRSGTQNGDGLTPLPKEQKKLTAEVYEVPYNQLWSRLAVLSDTTNGQLNSSAKFNKPNIPRWHKGV